MGRRFISQLSDGEMLEEVYLVGDKSIRPSRNGNLFLQVELRDRTGTIIGRLWNVNEAIGRLFDVGDFLQIQGKAQVYQGQLQIILNSIERIEAEKVELTDFLPHTEQDINDLLRRLRGFLHKTANIHLKALAETFLMDEPLMRDFASVPAGVKQHHAYIGGLLEHVVTMMDAVERLMPAYPGVDRDLLILGVFLHDIGKTRELTVGRGFTYTDEGQLIGHIAIGVEMLTDKAARVPKLTGEPFPRELLWRLKHMIVSHHGTLEWGSPVVPMTPEAIALHYIDNLDARIHTFVREIKADRNPTSAWTQFNQSMGRRVFKGLASGTAASIDADDDDDYS